MTKSADQSCAWEQVDWQTDEIDAISAVSDYDLNVKVGLFGKLVWLPTRGGNHCRTPRTNPPIEIWHLEPLCHGQNLTSAL